MQDPISNVESNKTELNLGINSFDNPTKLSELQAWSQLMLNLTFLRPGTFPSQPEMGVDIEKYQFDFIDDATAELSTKITDQQQKYLPDVPLTGVVISTTEYQKSPILLIQYIFSTRNGNVASVVAVDMNSKGRNFLNFDISW